jgi:hypothetical protein
MKTPLLQTRSRADLLPEGCKDLVDVLRLEQEQIAAEQDPSDELSPEAVAPPQFPTTVSITDPVTVRDLAVALHVKPYFVIAGLMHFNTFASLNTQIDFGTVSALCSRFGVVAHKII